MNHHVLINIFIIFILNIGIDNLTCLTNILNLCADLMIVI